MYPLKLTKETKHGYWVEVDIIPKLRKLVLIKMEDAETGTYEQRSALRTDLERPLSTTIPEITYYAGPWAAIKCLTLRKQAQIFTKMCAVRDKAKILSTPFAELCEMSASEFGNVEQSLGEGEHLIEAYPSPRDEKVERTLDIHVFPHLF